MQLILSDDDRRLLIEGVSWVQAHYDEINYYRYELTRDRIDELALIVASTHHDLTDSEYCDLRALAFALEGLVDSGLPLSETALEKMYERL